LEYGNEAAIAWLRATFGEEMIKRVISNERRLSRKSANFWALAYRIPSDQVAARKPTVSSSVFGQVVNSLERDGRIWHREVITEAVERTLLDLQRMSALTNFYIAGGTGLALHLGHGRSIDLDLFTGESFDPDTILGKVERLTGLPVLARDLETPHLSIGETKVSFLAYRYPPAVSLRGAG